MTDDLSRFTQRAKSVLAFTEHYARAFMHSHIRTEHLLFSILVNKGCLALTVLENLGCERAKLGRELLRLSNPGTEVVWDAIPQGLQVQEVIRWAKQEAVDGSSEFIGTEHLLLGLIREGNGNALVALKECGIKAIQDVKDEILRLDSPREVVESAISRKDAASCLVRKIDIERIKVDPGGPSLEIFSVDVVGVDGGSWMDTMSAESLHWYLRGVQAGTRGLFSLPVEIPGNPTLVLSRPEDEPEGS